MGGGGSKQAFNTTLSISQVVGDHCVVIFSKTTCGYCRLAKGVFEEMGVKYHVVELNQRPDGHNIKTQLQSITGISTVPQVFVNGNCIGGGQETKQLHVEGKLAQLVRQCAPCSDNSRKH